MLLTKAQSTIEFVVVIMFFIIVATLLLTSYLKVFPAEAGKASEQVACSQAETLAIQLLEFPGNLTNWNSGGELNELGFSRDNEMEINYSKFKEAKSRGYYNITTDANLSIPFKLKYDAYAFNYTEDNLIDSTPEDWNPRVFIMRHENNIVIYAGSNSTTAEFSMTLFFPFVSITDNNCTTGTLEAGDTNTSITKLNSTQVELSFSIGSADLDCINLSMSEVPDLIFIKDMSLKNTKTGQDYPIYLWNETILNNEFGSSGDIDKDKSYCEIERIGLVVNGNNTIPTRFKVISWR